MRAITKAEHVVADSVVYGAALGSFVYAPYAYGCTRDWAAQNLAIWLGLVFTAALFKWAFFDRRLPLMPRLPLILLVGLNALGWFMVWNVRYFYDAMAMEFIPLMRPLPWAPGSMDPSYAKEGMWIISGLSGGFIVLCDMAASAVWRKRLLWTIAVTGGSIGLFGVTLKIGGFDLMRYFWEEHLMFNTNFAMYRYHGNAAAYLNLTWPIALGFALAALADPKRRSVGIGWILCFGIIFAGCMINISKAGVLISVTMLIIFLIWRWRVHQSRKKQEAAAPSNGPAASKKMLFKIYAALISLVILAFVLLAVALATKDVSGWSRWFDISNEKDTSVLTRYYSYVATSHMVPKAGWFGLGSNTFRIVFPFYQAKMGALVEGYWKFAHEDYLQTVVEWGWAGSACWAVILFGGWFRGWKTFFNRTNFSCSEDRLLLFASCLALSGVMFHALFDFPLQIASLRWYALAFLAIGWNSHYYGIETAAGPAPEARKKRHR